MYVWKCTIKQTVASFFLLVQYALCDFVQCHLMNSKTVVHVHNLLHVEQCRMKNYFMDLNYILYCSFLINFLVVFVQLNLYSIAVGYYCTVPHITEFHIFKGRGGQYIFAYSFSAYVPISIAKNKSNVIIDDAPLSLSACLV